MEVFVLILWVLLSFGLIIFGGDFFIDSAVWIAKKTKIPEVIIGATIVSLGTTLPEIFVSITAAVKGEPGLALGNAAGSMLCNLALILGLTIILKPHKGLEKKPYLQKFILGVSLCGLLFWFIADGVFVLWESIFLVAFFALFAGLQIFEGIKDKHQKANAPVPLSAQVAVAPPASGQGAITVKAVAKGSLWSRVQQHPAFKITMFFVGAAAIAAGANIMVDNVVILCADYLKIPSEVIGYTVVAFGTSLPEFVTAMTSIRKKASSLSFGNIIGANIINGSFILGICGTIAGTAGFIVTDMLSLWLALGIVAFFTTLLAVTVLWKGKTFRAQGSAMVAAYVAYVIVMIALI